MSRRPLRALFFVAGLGLGGRACLPSLEDCPALTLDQVPTGDFPINETWPDGTTGSIQIYEDRVEVTLLHPTWGQAEATYT
jgi:hypothetical protein